MALVSRLPAGHSSHPVTTSNFISEYLIGSKLLCFRPASCKYMATRAACMATRTEWLPLLCVDRTASWSAAPRTPRASSGISTGQLSWWPWLLVSHGCLCHMAACVTWLLVSHGCLCHTAACVTWLLVSHGCLCHMAACVTWLLVSHGCLCHTAACVTWLLVSHGCLCHMAACVTWLLVSHGCLCHTAACVTWLHSVWFYMAN